MASEPLLSTSEGRSKHTKASIFYGADQYLDALKAKYEHDHELASMNALLPDGGDPNSTRKGQNTGDKVLQIAKNNANRSNKTGRLLPVPKKPDPMPAELAFLFTKIAPEQMMYMWNIVTMIFVAQCLMTVGYCLALYYLGDEFWWRCTLAFGLPFVYLGIQNIYIDHDVMHGATFPPYEWQKFLTHPWADQFSLPWEEFVLEHNRHHASTYDLLQQGEFGWDPEEFQYALLEWTWVNGKKPFPIHPFGLVVTGLLLPVIHLLGLNDTGCLFALEWYNNFPDEGTGGKCNKELYKKWLPRRIKHHSFVALLWMCVFLLGHVVLNDGCTFFLTVTFFARCGFSAAWMFITNFNHSHPWQNFLRQDPERNYPWIHNIMATIHGGKHRWNEMLFHDVHHAFPNAVGTLSQRGRFHGWRKVHDACVEVLHNGLWVENGDAETDMQKNQRSRSVLMKSNKAK